MHENDNVNVQIPLQNRTKVIYSHNTKPTESHGTYSIHNERCIWM